MSRIVIVILIYHRHKPICPSVSVGTHCFNLQCRRVVQVITTKQKVRTAGAEYEGGTFLQNVSERMPDHTTSHPRKQYSLV
jgi:hypothetical protein